MLSGCASTLPCNLPARATERDLPPSACRTDGCTLVPDSNFRECCVRHDEEYWFGGSKADRKQADEQLRQCIADHDHGTLAKFYYRGVRIGGSPRLPLPWRWGFGWPYFHDYDVTAEHAEKPIAATTDNVDH